MYRTNEVWMKPAFRMDCIARVCVARFAFFALLVPSRPPSSLVLPSYCVKMEHWTLNITTARCTILTANWEGGTMHIFQITEGYSSASFFFGLYIFGYEKFVVIIVSLFSCFIGWSERDHFLFLSTFGYSVRCSCGTVNNAKWKCTCMKWLFVYYAWRTVWHKWNA